MSAPSIASPSDSAAHVVGVPRIVRAWLVVEFCDAALFKGWHAYIRANPEPGMRNGQEWLTYGVDGWGWIRSSSLKREAVVRMCAELGIKLKGDWTCDDDGLDDVAQRFPLAGHKRGGFPITIGDYGRIERDCPNSTL